MPTETMDGSSELNLRSTVDGRHVAAIDSARRQFERAGIRGPTSSAPGAAETVAARSAAWLAERLPDYEIGTEIHRGGQGVVYRSLQRGTQREVAIKVMRDGPFGGALAKSRFEREIQILAQFRHPNIVTIHDSGSVESGFYFVMDYIAGRTLDAYVSDARLGVRETLALFVKICRAVHAAHLHGVIHRDLKPANIRVDPSGEPHLLDFGLAKIIEDDAPAADSAHASSQTGQFIGSLPWASPEQLEGKSGEIDVRTDVYSLGVVLFQALTCRLPYEVGVNMRQAVENICRAEPPSPSTVSAGIDGEVDAIVLKCLRKAKDQRYQSAGDLAGDIERYLAGEPIDAKRDSGWYVFSKQLRRHRLAVSIVAAFMVVVAGALVSSVSFWRQAVRERDIAQIATIDAIEARDEARKQEAVAAAVSRFLTRDVLQKLDPYNTQGEALTARALFEQAAKDVDAGAFRDQPLVEFEVRTVLGMVYHWMSDFAHAETHLRAALSIARGELGEENENTLSTLRRLGNALSRQGKLDEAGQLLRQAMEIQSRTRGDDDLSTVLSRSHLAGWYLDMDRPDEAESLYRMVLDARIRLQGEDHVDTLAVMSNLAHALGSQGKYAEAEALYRDSLRLKRKIHGDQHPETLVDLMHLANTLRFTGRSDEAMPIAKEAYEGLRERMGVAAESTQSAMLTLARLHQTAGEFAEAEALLREAVDYYRASDGAGYQIVVILFQLGVNLIEQGKLTEAEGVLRDALAAYERVGGNAIDRLRILSHLVNVLGEQGKSADAVTAAEESMKLSRQTYGDEHETTAIFVNNYAYALLQSGNLSEAEAQCRQALAMQRDDHPLTYNLMHNLALALGEEDHQEERELLLRTSLEGRRRLFGDDDPLTLKTMQALAALLRDQKTFDEAEALLREALGRAEKRWPSGHFMTEHYRRALGVCLAAEGRFEEAEPLLLLSYERDRELLPPGHPNHVEGIQKLVDLYIAWGKPEQADHWREERPNRTAEPSTQSDRR